MQFGILLKHGIALKKIQLVNKYLGLLIAYVQILQGEEDVLTTKTIADLSKLLEVLYTKQLVS